MKLQFVIALLVPLLKSAASLLESVDDNSTGIDDQAAKLLRSAAAGLEEYGKA